MSASHNPKLSAMWILEPETAELEVADALKKYDGNVTDAATYLRVGKATLYRWMDDRPILYRVRDAARHDAIEREKGEER
jgi:phage antirepressor YoqD-like protein